MDKQTATTIISVVDADTLASECNSRRKEFGAVMEIGVDESVDRS